MEFIIPVVVVGFFALAGFSVYKNTVKKKRLKFIASYSFHPVLKEKVIKKYSHLSNDEADLVMEGLRDYFLFCIRAEKRMVSMPSQAVDVAWHEFILFTRSYESFCQKAFGHFLHHTPTEAMKSPTVAKDGIRRAWRLACAKERIDPKKPSKLPLLFALDGLLNIPDGFRYSLDCKDPNSPHFGNDYCASHIGCGGGCGGDSASCGASGCVGDGCGGGCGGD